MACDGPNSSKWDGEACIQSAHQTSCDEINETTCYYAALEFSPPSWLGGQFVDKGAEEGDFRIDTPVPELGIKAGDIMRRLNGRVPTAKAILKFTTARPASDGSCLRMASDDRIELCLWR